MRKREGIKKVGIDKIGERLREMKSWK